MVSKQLLLKAIAGLTGVATLGLSSLSFAGGDYAPAPAPTPAPVAEEGKAGFYAGVRAGYGKVQIDKKDLIESESLKNKGFAGGVNVGYAFNKFLGLEAGYMYVPPVKYQNYSFDEKYVTKVNAFDISAKGTLPISLVEGLGVYGKVGVGFVNAKGSSNLGESAKSNVTTFAYGAGLSYDLTSNIRLEAGWQRWNKRDTKKYHLPNIDTATVGVSYFFGGNELFNS